MTYSATGGTDTGLSAGTYFVIAVDMAIQLASSLAAATRTPRWRSPATEPVTDFRAAGDGVAAAMIVNTAPGNGSTTESATDGSSHWEDLNTAAACMAQ